MDLSKRAEPEAAYGESCKSGLGGRDKHVEEEQSVWPVGVLWEANWGRGRCT